MSSDTLSTVFNILLVGDAGVGKTVFISRHHTGEFVKSYIATQGCKTTNLPMYTTMGKIVFHICDMAGQEKYSHNEIVQHTTGADAAIIMFDVTAHVSYKSVPGWYESIRKKHPGIPVVLCGTKVDCKDRKVKPAEIQFHKKHNIQYYDISAKSNYNFEKPFLYISRKLIGDNNITFTEGPAVFPPEVKVSDEQIAAWQSENENDRRIQLRTQKESPTSPSHPPIVTSPPSPKKVSVLVENLERLQDMFTGTNLLENFISSDYTIHNELEKKIAKFQKQLFDRLFEIEREEIAKFLPSLTKEEFETLNKEMMSEIDESE